jgi:RNA recognition motif-containing protein
MTSIFVAKLDFGITNEQLKEAFQPFGNVLKATVALDRETGKSRGFGFVEMANRDEALQAIETLDGSNLNGRTISVKEADNRGDQRGNRDNRPDRKPFQGGERKFNDRPSGDRPDRPDNRFKADGPRTETTNRTAPVTPPVIPDINKDPRKKEKDKKPKDGWDADGKNKKPKMNAYKKSGKGNRFFDDDDDDFEDDDLDLFNYKREEDEDFFDDEDED